MNNIVEMAKTMAMLAWPGISSDKTLVTLLYGMPVVKPSLPLVGTVKEQVKLSTFVTPGGLQFRMGYAAGVDELVIVV